MRTPPSVLGQFEGWASSALERLRKTTMGRFDSRNSEKMTRRKGQQKKKERLARRAEATKAARKAAKPTKKSKG